MVRHQTHLGESSARGPRLQEHAVHSSLFEIRLRNLRLRTETTRSPPHLHEIRKIRFLRGFRPRFHQTNPCGPQNRAWRNPLPIAHSRHDPIPVGNCVTDRESTKIHQLPRFFVAERTFYIPLTRALMYPCDFHWLRHRQHVSFTYLRGKPLCFHQKSNTIVLVREDLRTANCRPRELGGVLHEKINLVEVIKLA